MWINQIIVAYFIGWYEFQKTRKALEITDGMLFIMNESSSTGVLWQLLGDMKLTNKKLAFSYFEMWNIIIYLFSIHIGFIVYFVNKLPFFFWIYRL